MRYCSSIVPAIGIILLATSAHAGDGVIEINQAKALAGGINGSLVSDLPGFPVVITESGSYVLTGILTVPDVNTTGISVGASRVSIDLNGFGIDGPGTCSAVSCPSGTGTGIVSDPNAGDITVKNGFIHGVGNNGVQITSFGLVKNVSISEVGGAGISTLGGSVIVENRIGSVGGNGMDIQLFAPGLETRSVYSDNVIINVGLGAGGGQSVVGGLATGGNYCGDGGCAPRGRRRFYVTDNSLFFDGANALTACVDGFHMASLWEIWDTSNLVYDTRFGHTLDDSGKGPPAGNFFAGGWVRTGMAGGSGSSCFAWTENTNFDNGTVASVITFWNSLSTERSDPWDSETRPCSQANRVWCVED